MAQDELRPMGVGEILDGAFRLYRNRLGTFLLIALVVYIPYAVLAGAQQLLLQQGAMTSGEGGEVMLAIFIVSMLLMFIAAFIAMPLCQGAMTHTISASYLDETIGASESYRRALPRVLTLLGANILVGLIVMAGYILLIVPGVIFQIWFLLTSTVVMLEPHGVTRSMSRSRELMRGNLGKGFVIGLVVFVLGLLFQMVVGGLTGFLFGLAGWQSPALIQFINTLLYAFILPMQVAPVILLYYDLRIRKEGFDLERLAELEPSADGAPTVEPAAPSETSAGQS